MIANFFYQNANVIVDGVYEIVSHWKKRLGVRGTAGTSQGERMHGGVDANV